MWYWTRVTKQCLGAFILISLIWLFVSFFNKGFSTGLDKIEPAILANNAATIRKVENPHQPNEKQGSSDKLRGENTEKKGLQLVKVLKNVKNPIPKVSVLTNRPIESIVNLYHSYVMSPQATCGTVRRMGVVKDGGWEMCDDPLFKPNSSNCLVYSFGINYDFSFDDDMAEYGCEIHAFDPSMGNTAEHMRGHRIHFHPVGIGKMNGTKISGKPPNRWQLFTLNSLRTKLGHAIEKRHLDILKMDVEGDELGSLLTALKEGSLKDVRQLSLETHLAFVGVPPKEQYIMYLDLLRRLYDAGFRIYLTSRNHVWSSFMSPVIKKQRVTCHEINMVNINIINPIEDIS